MRTSSWQFCRGVIASVLVAVFAVQPSLPAQTHVVSPAELRNEAVAATRDRKQNVEAVIQFLSSPRAEKTLRAAHMDPTRVKGSVSLLSDQELADLASRADRAQVDFAAGALTERDMLLILLGLAGLILIIVAVR